MLSNCITIIIPLHNHSEYIEETLSSLLFQSYSEWQCIIIDDGSTDNSPVLVRNLIKNDSRFRFINRENSSTNRNANVCRNIGLKIAETKYVMFLDADDYIHKNCLKNRMLKISKENADVYVFRTAFVSGVGEILGYFKTDVAQVEDLIYLFILHKMPWHTMSPVWSSMFLKSLGGWNEEYERLQDVELSIRALLARPVIEFSNMPVDSYYRMGNTFSERKKKLARMGFCRLVKDYHKKIRTDNLIETITKINIQEVFQNILESQFTDYIKITEERDFEWETLYLNTLQVLEFNKSDQKTVRKIFSKL